MSPFFEQPECLSLMSQSFNMASSEAQDVWRPLEGPEYEYIKILGKALVDLGERQLCSKLVFSSTSSRPAPPQLPSYYSIMLQVAKHPSALIGPSAITFWRVALRTESLSHLDHTLHVLPTLLEMCLSILIKVSEHRSSYILPNSPSIHSCSIHSSFSWGGGV